MKSCRPVVRNGYSTLQMRSISPQNAEKFSGFWDNIQSWCLRRPIQFHTGWLLRFSCYHIQFQLFVLSFHQLTASCNQLVTVGLGNTIKLPPQLQHKSSFTFLLSPRMFHRINKSASKTFCELPHHSRDYWLSSKRSFLHCMGQQRLRVLKCSRGVKHRHLASKVLQLVPFGASSHAKMAWNLSSKDKKKGRTKLSPQCILNGSRSPLWAFGNVATKAR